SKSGISAIDKKKLEKTGFLSVETLAFSPERGMLSIKGISKVKADKILVRIIWNLNPRYSTSLFPLG
ncbi:hypothetical protein Nmel_010650, partial [Mimus melanotis]